MDNWFKSLSSGSRPLSWLAKKVPIFNKREEVLTTLSEHGVTAARDTIRRSYQYIINNMKISMRILHFLTSSDVIIAILLRSFSSSWNLQTDLAISWILVAP